MPPRLPQLLAALCAMFAALPALALDDAGQAAATFLRDALRVQRDGRHDRVLNALRHLRDPALEPLYAALATSDRPAPHQVHGMLGLAELSPRNRLDLTRLAEVEQVEVQATIVSNALDTGLLTDPDADQLLRWDGLDPSVKTVVALRRFREPGFADLDLLRESLNADKLGRRGLAALMLHQLGDPAGTDALAALNASTDEERDRARRLLLQTALREGFDRAGSWAYSVATDDTADELTRLLATRTAIRFGERRAAEHWTRRFADTTDPAAQVRLALTVLHVAPWSPPDLFDPLRASADPLLRQIGDAGQAVAVAGPEGGDVAEQVVALLLLHHPYTNSWALEYAKAWATPQDAQLICLGLIKAFEEGPRQTRPRRVAETVHAAQLLHERYPAVAAAILVPMLGDTTGAVGDLTRQAILLGLLQSKSDVSAVAAALPPMSDPELASVALLLKARAGASLTDAEAGDLRLLARGGGSLRDELRAQAAWLFLRQSGQAREALAALTR